MVQASLGIRMVISKVTNMKKTADVALVQQLPSKTKALSSTPSTTHTHTKKTTRRDVRIDAHRVLYPSPEKTLFSGTHGTFIKI
jgi:hypothetical protein